MTLPRLSPPLAAPLALVLCLAGRTPGRAQETAAAAGVAADTSAYRDSIAAMPGMPMMAQSPPSDSPGGPPTASSGQSGSSDNSKGLLQSVAMGANGPAQTVSGLKPKDRDAIRLLEKESPPAEYSSTVGQYTKNLSAGDSPKTELP